jgi:hypothetical protein
VVIISRNPKALEEALQEIHNTAQEIELIIWVGGMYENKKDMIGVSRSQ